MTVQAPLHSQIGVLQRQRHFVHPSMTGLAADTFRHVNTVVEVDEVRQVVDARPPDGPVLAKGRPHRLQRRAGPPDLRVAVHTRLHRRNVGEARFLHSGMTIPAVDPDSTDMVDVAERHGLFTRHILAC